MIPWQIALMSGSVGGWSPLALSPSGLWDVSILSSLYQDRSATPSTPSVVDGVVGTICDQSGAGNHLIAPSDAARGILRQSGSLYWVETDGVDDVYRTNAAFSGLASASEFEVCVGGRVTTAADSRRFLDVGDGYMDSPLFRTNSPLDVRGRIFDGVSNKDTSPVAYTTGADFVWSGRLKSGIHYGRLNNGAENSLASGNISQTSVTFGIMGGSSSGFVAGRLYCAVIMPNATSSDNRLLLRQWVGSRANVSITA